jgi:hypothetical protein
MGGGVREATMPFRPLAAALAIFASAAAADARDLKYDDGKPDGALRVGGVGSGIWFEGPVEAECVKIHAARERCAAFDVVVLDRDRNIVAQAAYDGAALPETAGWAKLALRIRSEAGVLVVVTFNEEEEAALSWDATEEERHSTWFYDGNHHPFDRGNWMIRLGTDAGEKPKAFETPPFPPGQVLKADAGEARDCRRSEAGHAVRFERPEKTALAGIEVYGARHGRLARPFDIHVCDDRLRTLARATAAVGHIGEDEQWWPLPFEKPLAVPRAFWIVVDFHDSPADNVAVGYCANDAAVCAEAKADGLFRKFPPGEAWMIRARLATADEPAEAAPPKTSETGQVPREIAKKFFKALERLDRDRFLAVLAPDAPGFDWIREGDSKFLDGSPHRRFTREVGARIDDREAVLVYAALEGPLLWDPPDELRDAMPPAGRLAPGPNLFRTDGPGRHARPRIFALRMRKHGDAWELRGWDEVDAEDAAWGRGLLAEAPSPEEALAALAKARSEAVAAIDAEIREIEDAGQKERLLADAARLWAEEGDVPKWAEIVKTLPEDPQAMLRQWLPVETRRTIALGPDEKAARAVAELADTLLDALEKRFALRPRGAGKLRVILNGAEEEGYAAHPRAWAYPEIVWFASEEARKRPPDAHELALAIADACVVFWDDAGQMRRWLAAGMMAEASLAGMETPAKLQSEVRNIVPARDTVGGHLRIFIEVSRKWGDGALGRAVAAARRDGAWRETPQGRGLCLDELMKALGKETGSEDEVRKLFGR